jgi:chemotaxis-related protein WspB
MLCLLLRLGEWTFALPCSRVARVIPNVPLCSLPEAPPYIAGLLQYRGGSLPVLDLSALVCHHPSAPILSSRIILIRYEGNQLLGILAEQVMETARFEAGAFVTSGVKLENAPYLNKVASTENGLVQLIELERLLPDDLKAQLFAPHSA